MRTETDHGIPDDSDMQSVKVCGEGICGVVLSNLLMQGKSFSSDIMT